MWGLFALLGGIVGWGIGQLSDLAPRYAVRVPSDYIPPVLPRGSALWRWAKGDRERWRWLDALTELGTAVAFGWIAARFGATLEGAFVLLVFAFLLLVAVVDLKHRLILNVYVYPAIALAIAGNLVIAQRAPAPVLLGGGLAFGIFFLTAWLRPGDLGMGDVKLAALIGFTFGFPQVLWALIVGAGAGALMVVVLLARGAHRKARMPYAPFLCFGALFALLYNPMLGIFA